MSRVSSHTSPTMTANSRKMKHQNGYSSAQKFVDNLLSEGAKVSCDESYESFNKHDDLPPFYDDQLFKKGQAFFYKHIFAFFFSKMIGLLSVLAIPSILKILMHTKMSGSDMTAYKRYMATIFHMMVWYESDFKPGSRLWKSISEVRGRHNSASKRSCKAGLHSISQKDMALTQFGFMGYSLARSKMIGIHQASEEEWEAFLHVWRVIGYLMGIEDRFNLCNGTVEETREICKLLIEQVFRPYIEQRDEDFLKMTGYLAHGLWCFSPLVQYESVLCYMHALVKSTGDNGKIIPTYFKLNSSQNFNFYLLVNAIFLLKRDWFRIFQNYSKLLSLWLMKVFPFLAYYQFGVANSHVYILADGNNNK